MLAAPRYGSVRKNSCLCVARILSYCYHCFLCDCLFFRASRGHQSRILILFLHFFALCRRWRYSNWWLLAYTRIAWLPWHDRGGIFLEDINAWWERRLICIKNYGPFLIFFVSSSSPVCLLINMHKKLWHKFFWFFTVFSFLVLYGFGDVASLYIW